MNDSILAIVLACVGSSGLWACIQKFMDRKKVKLEDLQAENKKQWICINQLTKQSTAILKDRHMQMCRYLLKKGSITESEAETLESLHSAYEAAGLNGWGKKLYDRCMNLPLVREDDGQSN